MSRFLFLSDAEAQASVSLPQAIEAVALASRALAGGNASLFTIVREPLRELDATFGVKSAQG
jgi:hypothetical protein